MSYRRELRRAKGPRFRPGPRGVIRAAYARCGLCQRVETRPADRLDPAAWRICPDRGAIHARCGAYRTRRELVRAAESGRSSAGRPFDRPYEPLALAVLDGSRRRAWWADVPVWILGAHRRHPMTALVELQPRPSRRIIRSRGRHVAFDVLTIPADPIRWAPFRELAPDTGALQFRIPLQA